MFTVGLIPTEMRGHFYSPKHFLLRFSTNRQFFFLRFSSAISISTTLCDIFSYLYYQKIALRCQFFFHYAFFSSFKERMNGGGPAPFFSHPVSPPQCCSLALCGVMLSEWEMVIFVFNELDSVLRWKEVTKLMSQSFTSK